MQVSYGNKRGILGVVPKFLDLEEVFLKLAVETERIDRYNWLFEHKLNNFHVKTPNFISRRQFNDHHKTTNDFCEDS